MCFEGTVPKAGTGNRKTAPWEDGTVSNTPRIILGGIRFAAVGNSGGTKGGEMPPPVQTL